MSQIRNTYVLKFKKLAFVMHDFTKTAFTTNSFVICGIEGKFEH